LLTHDKTVDYIDDVWLIKKSGNADAVAVKLADIRHNSDLSRLAAVTDKDRERHEKYLKAIAILER
jgi:hypothetical protein